MTRTKIKDASTLKLRFVNMEFEGNTRTQVLQFADEWKKVIESGLLSGSLREESRSWHEDTTRLKITLRNDVASNTLMDGIYLLHFDPPYKHAGHYLGYASDIDRRISEHQTGKTKASPLARRSSRLWYSYPSTNVGRWL
jgi:hypothetical protein